MGSENLLAIMFHVISKFYKTHDLTRGLILVLRMSAVPFLRWLQSA